MLIIKGESWLIQKEMTLWWVVNGSTNDLVCAILLILSGGWCCWKGDYFVIESANSLGLIKFSILFVLECVLSRLNLICENFLYFTSSYTNSVEHHAMLIQRNFL